MLAALLAAAVLQTNLEASIDSARMMSDIRKLASFTTRNTNSPTLNEAAEWLAAQYRAIPGMQVELMKYKVEASARIPEAIEVVQVVATLRGEDDRRIIVGGHLDSLNLSVDAKTGPAPGANDDASGTVVALEVARAMATRKWKHTLVFVGWTGEEQGLLGSRAMAERAKADAWKIDAVLSNDTVGSPVNKHGQRNDKQVRVFSEEVEEHESRALARFIAWLTKDKPFGVKLVFRRDRFGRGGDHTPFSQNGFNAVRFVEVHEEYTRQHTPDDLPEFVDANYVANVAKVNLLVMASLANAAEPPENVRIDRRQGHDTTVTWRSTPGVSYVVYWRDTASPVWQGSKDVGAADRATIEKINKDDHVFAVGAVGGIPVEAR
ncbi:MAG: M20/M25/M40 family metallo-hydrolase [Armatimonadota bacterium]|nr:M20/M25/M40 family metallo-hydrolase [Armatimonadota bacterium]